MSYNKKLFNFLKKSSTNETINTEPLKITNVKSKKEEVVVPYNMVVPYLNKVPLKIFQTWFTKKLPPSMQSTMNNIKKANPEFEHYLYDDEDCHNFIKKNYSADILEAFDKLIPGAYKADLWRYCVLYFYGGVYIDIKFQCKNNFKLIDLIDKEYFVSDLELSGFGIYNGLIIVKQRNEKLLRCINEIVINTKNNFYGDTFLHVTGPKLLDTFFKDEEKKNIELNLYLENGLQSIKIKNKNLIILTEYNNYREEHDNFSNKKHYGILWKNRMIYNL